MRDNSKSARGGWSNNRMKDNLKVREMLKSQSNERQFKSAREAEVTIEWETILKVREKPK